LVAPPGPSHSTGPKSRCSSNSHSLLSVISPSYIGRSDLAMSRDSDTALCNQTPKPRWSKVNLGEFLLAAPSLCLPNPRVPKRRSIGFTPPVPHRIFGAHAATSASGIRESRIHHALFFAAGIPECRNPDTLDSCHLSALRSTVPTKSGNRTSRLRRAWDYCTRQTRFADM
jgi:hypothetical protein